MYVKWDEQSVEFYLRGLNNKAAVLNVWHVDDTEVIGNFFENKELL